MNYNQLSLSVLCAVLALPVAAVEANSPWAMEVEAGLGYDSNAYLAPSESYVDYAPATPVPVDPDTRSGVFIPVNVDVDYDGRAGGSRGFIGSYAFSGKFYPDSKTDNANEFNHTLKGGMEFLIRRDGKREDTVSVTPYFGVHDKTYFNRDTGEEMVSNAGTDLSDRYSYSVTGIKGELKHETARIPHGIHAELARLDYVEPSSNVFDSYDHDYFRIGGDVEFALAAPTKLVLSYDYYTRNYDERKARDLTGDMVAGTEREYVYNKFGASLRQKMSADFTMYLDYDVTDRSDEYVGYYDYTQNSFGLRAIYDKDNIRVKAKAVWWERDYDKAFAFDDPAQDDMTYDSTEYSVKGDYDLAKNYGLWAEFKSVDQDSTDLRYDYERYQLMAGWRWEK